VCLEPEPVLAVLKTSGLIACPKRIWTYRFLKVFLVSLYISEIYMHSVVVASQPPFRVRD
jgi:hypothetical protein